MKRLFIHAPPRSLPALCERGKPEKCVCADDDFLFMVVFLSVLRRQQRRPRAKNAISRENLQVLCPFRECSCAVEGASGNGEQVQLGKTSAKGEAKQRGANLPTVSARPFLRSRPLSGDVGVDVVKHEPLAHRMEVAEMLSDVVMDIVARPRFPRTSAPRNASEAEDTIGPAPIWYTNAHEIMPIQLNAAGRAASDGTQEKGPCRAPRV